MKDASHGFNWNMRGKYEVSEYQSQGKAKRKEQGIFAWFDSLTFPQPTEDPEVGAPDEEDLDIKF